MMEYICFFLSGYRSINLQNDIFYTLKSKRNQIASERARVSAPPGYSEHSTGFALILEMLRKEIQTLQSNLKIRMLLDG